MSHVAKATPGFFWRAWACPPYGQSEPQGGKNKSDPTIHPPKPHQVLEYNVQFVGEKKWGWWSEDELGALGTGGLELLTPFREKAWGNEVQPRKNQKQFPPSPKSGTYESEDTEDTEELEPELVVEQVAITPRISWDQVAVGWHAPARPLRSSRKEQSTKAPCNTMNDRSWKRNGDDIFVEDILEHVFCNVVKAVGFQGISKLSLVSQRWKNVCYGNSVWAAASNKSMLRTFALRFQEVGRLLLHVDQLVLGSG